MHLWRFNGGLRLPEHKSESSSRPIEAAQVSAQLIYPLQQHIGHAAQPQVKPGDHVLRGQKIAEADGAISASIHAGSSGTVHGIYELPIPHPSGLAGECIVIDTDGLDQSIHPTVEPEFRHIEPKQLLRKIREAGIVGLGGAAFPTAIKLTTKSDSRRIKTLVINGAECEPYITCDDRLMAERSDAVIEGIEIVMHMIQPDEAILAIEDTCPETFSLMTNAALRNGNPRIRVVQIPTIYPTGGEKQLIKTLTGKEVPSNGIPAEIGIVSINVGTTYAVRQAILEGLPLTSRVITVTGAGVAQPRNLEVRLGTPIKDLVAQCGGYTDEADRLIMGGPMMGFSLLNDDIPVIKATNCILVASGAEAILEKTAMPCIRCGLCANACPATLLPQQLYWYSRSEQYDKAEQFHLFDCIECGCCDVVCPSHIPLVQYFRSAKSDIKMRKHERHKADIARERFEAREKRLAAEKAERAAKARKKKQALENRQAAKAGKDEIEAAIARSKAKKAQRAADSDASTDTPSD